MKRCKVDVGMPRLTCTTPIRKYQDIDTGKYNLDRMHKIQSVSLGEHMITDDILYGSYSKPPRSTDYQNWKKKYPDEC